jgi:fluoroquinolone transport system permease protein
MTASGRADAVLRASVCAVPARAVALHVTAAVALVVATWGGLDDEGTAVAVLRGVAVLLAAALAFTVDEPAAALLDATPTPMVQRLAARLALCAVLVLPAWGVALAVASLRGPDVPLVALTLELGALGALGLAVPLALRRWWRLPEPALVAGPLLLGALLGAAHLPRRLVLLPATPLDPAWDAAHLRWSVLLLAALGLLVNGLADPATARVARRWRCSRS